MKKILLGCVLVSGLFAGGDRAFKGLQFALNEGIPNCTGEKKAYLLKIKEIMKEWK